MLCLFQRYPGMSGKNTYKYTIGLRLNYVLCSIEDSLRWRKSIEFYC